MVIVDATVVGGRERAVKGVRYVWGECVGEGEIVQVYMGRRMCVWGPEREEEGRGVCMCEGGGRGGGMK